MRENRRKWEKVGAPGPASLSILFYSLPFPQSTLLPRFLLLLVFFFILSNQFSLPLSWMHLSPAETFFTSRCSVRNFGSPIILYHIIFYLSIDSSLGRIIYSPTFIISKIFYGVKYPVAKDTAPIKLYHNLFYKSNRWFFITYEENFARNTVRLVLLVCR